MEKDSGDCERDAIKLSPVVIKGIQSLRDVSDNEVAHRIIEKSFRRVVEDEDDRRVAEDAPDASVEASVALIEYALVSLMVIAAKNNLTSNELRHLVNHHGAGESLSGQIARKYELSLPDLLAKLSTYGYTEPFVADANWKMSCSIQSHTSLNTHGELLYKISLEDVDSTLGSTKSIANFTCNTEELQALIAKLKDIERHCDKIGKQ
uniref:COMM domain-containing protein 3 n=1 Tax=Lutzomyia longipalpis TaxID=7200 RepID=A0A7G3AE42_LUTLO